MKENLDDGEGTKEGFKYVPIERTKNNDDEIYNMRSGFSYLKYRLFKKICKYSFLFILIFSFIIFTKRMLLDGIFEYFNTENEYTYFASNNANSNRPDNYTFDESVFEFDEVEKYYIYQNISNINMKSLSSPQLKNPKNIKLVPKLEATLDLEYDKFVHLQIKDADNKRFEIPKKEILNQDYLYSLNNSRIPLSIYANYLEAQNFFIEFTTNKFGEYEIEHFRDIHMSEDEEFQNIESFAFKIMDTRENQLFRFNSTHNFIYSENYINFQYELTSDNIFGFGQGKHDFKINNGLYTISKINHFPIAIHKTYYENIWLGFVFLNSNAQDVKVYKKYKKRINVEHKTIGGIIDYYIIVDDSPEEILKDLQFLLGVPTLPPFWALGNHHYKYGYKNIEEFKSVYEQYKKYEIPIDSMWINTDNIENNRYNNISSYIKDEIQKDGGKIVASINYGLSYENQNSSLIKLGNSLDIFIKSNYTKRPLISRDLSGKIIFPDFSRGYPKIVYYYKDRNCLEIIVYHSNKKLKKLYNDKIFDTYKKPLKGLNINIEVPQNNNNNIFKTDEKNITKKNSFKKDNNINIIPKMPDINKSNTEENKNENDDNNKENIDVNLNNINVENNNKKEKQESNNVESENDNHSNNNSNNSMNKESEIKSDKSKENNIDKNNNDKNSNIEENNKSKSENNDDLKEKDKKEEIKEKEEKENIKDKEEKDEKEKKEDIEQKEEIKKTNTKELIYDYEKTDFHSSVNFQMASAFDKLNNNKAIKNNIKKLNIVQPENINVKLLKKARRQFNNYEISESDDISNY